jgi:hypothetical protein
MSQSTTASPDQERYSRRLSDKIQTAFDHACDEGELQVAADLLQTLELVLLRVAPKPDRREAVVAPLMASHERLWHLRAKNGTMAEQPPAPVTAGEH